MSNNNLKKSFIWNTLGTGLNSFNSLFFLIITTRINGINDAGIFTLCFATSCMFYCIAVYSGRTYQVTETQKDITDNDYILNRIITSIIMILISILFGLIKGYHNTKFIVLLFLTLFKVIEAISDVFHGILQKNERLDIVGKSLFIRSLLNILLFLIIDILTKDLILSCMSLIISNLIVLFTIDIKQSFNYKENIKKSNKKSVLKIFTLGFYTFAFMLIGNYLINIPRYSIDSLNNESLQTIFGIIIMPATMIMLVSQFILQPVITKLKENYIKKDKKSFLNIIKKLCLYVAIIGVICIVICYFLGIPFLNLLYGLKLDEYLIHLIIILFGATLYTLSNIFTNAIIIFRKTKMQFCIYLFVSIISYILSNYLITIFGFNGAVYSYSIMMALLLFFYLIYFLIIIKKKN